MTDPQQSTHHAIEHDKNAEIDIARVDVLIVARDRADTIERAVLSALAQDEVRAAIVVDDGSTDDTAARARRCDPEGKRLIIERLPSSVGPSAARNIAIEISTAPWLAILSPWENCRAAIPIRGLRLSGRPFDKRFGRSRWFCTADIRSFRRIDQTGTPQL
jgi:hypothetical protein